jgi:excisionase family DNA binding protein
MPATQAKKVEWLSKEEAAVRLGDPGVPMSTRRVLELAQQGRLQSTRAKHPASGQRVVWIHAGSVERYLEERNAPPPPKGEHERGSQSLVKRAPELRALLRALDALLVTTPPARPWLTLQEAADYSGIPTDLLVRLIRSGELPALRTHHRGDRYRIRRQALDQFGALRADEQALSSSFRFR